MTIPSLLQDTGPCFLAGERGLVLMKDSKCFWHYFCECDFLLLRVILEYKQILFEKDEGDERYVIVSADDTAFEPNLSGSEIAIDLLYSVQCPIKKCCVDYVVGSGVSIFCEHFKGFLQTAANKYSLAGFFCNNSKKYHELSQLKPVRCPIGRNNCMGCEKLLGVNTRPFPSKSNCHVVCDAAQG